MDSSHLIHENKACLRRIGLRLKDLEMKLFSELESDCRGMNRVARLKYVQALTGRVGILCDTRKKLQLFYTKGFFSVALSGLEQGVMNAAKVENSTDLMDVATTLKDSQVKTQARHTRRDNGIKCYKCQGWGHCAFECTARVEDQKPSLTCYVCHQP